MTQLDFTAVGTNQLSQESSARLAQLEAVNRISVALRVAQTLDEMLALLVSETQAVIDAAAVTIWLYEPDQGELRQAAAAGFPSMNIRLKPGQGITGNVFVQGQPHISREFKTDPRTDESARAQVPPDLAGAAIPIQTAHETLGVLFVSVLLPRELSADHVRLLLIIAEIAGLAIHRLRLRELTERRLRHLTALQTINLAITASLDLQVTLTILLDQVLTQLEANAADILLVNPETQQLDFVVGRGFQSKEIKRSVRLGEGLAGQAAVERRTVVYRGEASAAAFGAEMRVWFRDDQFASGFAVPLLARGQLRGVLEIFQRTLSDPNQEWLDFLQTLAEQATIAINNAAQFENLGRSNAELLAAYDTLIATWARALDKRENEPDGHAQRVAEMTVRLARALGVADRQCAQIYRGALLHDVGKLSVPETVLLKNGPLTEKEWILMRRHPLYAYELLAAVEQLKPALVIPYCHHEHWDGTGYPHGLKGEAIPQEARIFAVVDVWDALKSDRPYRPAWPEAKVLARLKMLAGTHFDPKIPDVFCKLLTE